MNMGRCRLRGSNGVQLMSFGRGGHQGRGKGRVTKKAGYDGGEGSNGDSRDSEWGGHVELNCRISAMYLLLVFFLRRAEKDGSLDL